MAILAQVCAARKRDSSVAVDLVASMLRFALYAHLFVCGASLPTSMTAVQASGTRCSGPDWLCLTVNSVNPIDIDGVEPVCVGFGCSVGTIGLDVAGTEVVVGDVCPFFVGDHQVWSMGKGAYAEYAVVSCSQMSLKPLSLSFMPSGAIPTIGLTAMQMFQKIGTPLVSSSSVAIVSGQGGTGSHGSPP